MELVRGIIEANVDKHINHDYYLIALEKAEQNLKLHPDICIEACKSLIEGICKAILKSIDNGLDERAIEGMTAKRLAERAMTDLSAFDESIEVNFITNFSNLMQDLASIRNKRGDVSHGHVSPKLVKSTPEFAEYIYRLTEHTVHYMLRVFYAIDFGSIAYGDNPDFNAMLDEEVQLDGKVLWSQALGHL